MISVGSLSAAGQYSLPLHSTNRNKLGINRRLSHPSKTSRVFTSNSTITCTTSAWPYTVLSINESYLNLACAISNLNHSSHLLLRRKSHQLQSRINHPQERSSLFSHVPLSQLSSASNISGYTIPFCLTAIGHMGRR